MYGSGGSAIVQHSAFNKCTRTRQLNADLALPASKRVSGCVVYKLVHDHSRSPAPV
jgi:hypothetical protein